MWRDTPRRCRLTPFRQGKLANRMVAENEKLPGIPQLPAVSQQ
jgi:hypothetical protein